MASPFQKRDSNGLKKNQPPTSTTARPIATNNAKIQNNNSIKDLAPDDDFVTGNFSAKYHTKQPNSSIASPIDSASFITDASSIKHRSLQQLQQQNPIYSIDGFETTTPSSSLKVLNSRSSHLRRQSGTSLNAPLTTSGSSFHNNDSGSGITSNNVNNNSVIAQSVNSDILNNPPSELVNTVGRHLVQDSDTYGHHPKANQDSLSSLTADNDGPKVDSLQLQSGDVTRDLYNWVNKHDEGKKRANSFSEFSSVNDPEQGSSLMYDDVSVDDLRAPGGFRRDFIKQKQNGKPQDFFTRNFIEFISLYGHFAGEEMDEDEDETDMENDDSEFVYDDYENDQVVDDDVHGDENLPLLQKHQDRYDSFASMDSRLIRQNLQMIRQLSFASHQRFSSSPRRGMSMAINNHPRSFVKPKRLLKLKRNKATTSNLKSFLLLLKAFLGTGVLFLPKSFSNGGLIYSNLMIIIFSILSYYCFVTLINIRSKLNVSSYGNLGLVLYGEPFKKIIMLSIILSQIGFSSLYIVFVATNLSQLCGGDSPDEGSFSVTSMILLQLVVFIPMSLIRKLSKLSFVVLVSDFFILLGLIYVYYYSLYNILTQKPHIDWDNITVFVNKDSWSLFIGTAIFTYEGIGLLIPIHESMSDPRLFNKLLLLVMVIITIIFITLGSLLYISFGDDVKTVILLNFEHSELIQFMYSLAILLSTPLQLFPGIKMIELIWFREEKSLPLRKVDTNDLDSLIDVVRSGKRDPQVKKQKNLLRISVVFVTVLISVIGSSDLDKFVSLIGSVTCVPLIYIFPPMLNLKLSKVDSISIEDYQINIRSQKEDESTFWTYVDYLMLLLGFMMMVYTSVSTLYSWIN